MNQTTRCSFFALAVVAAPAHSKLDHLHNFASVAGTTAVGVNRAAIRAIARSFGVELTSVEYQDADGISVVSWPSRCGPNDGLIVTGQLGQIQRDLRSAVLLQIV